MKRKVYSTNGQFSGFTLYPNEVLYVKIRNLSGPSYFIRLIDESWFQRVIYSGYDGADLQGFFASDESLDVAKKEYKTTATDRGYNRVGSVYRSVEELVTLSIEANVPATEYIVG